MACQSNSGRLKASITSDAVPMQATISHHRAVRAVHISRVSLIRDAVVSPVLPDVWFEDFLTVDNLAVVGADKIVFKCLK